MTTLRGRSRSASSAASESQSLMSLAALRPAAPPAARAAPRQACLHALTTRDTNICDATVFTFSH